MAPRFVTAGIALVLAVGTKPQLGLVALLLAPALFRQWWRSRRRAANASIVAAAAALVLAPFALENLATFGSASGPETLVFLVTRPGLATFCKNAVLLFSPLMPWLYDPRAATDWKLNYIDAHNAATQEGLGLVWPPLVFAALAWSLLGGPRRRASRAEIIGLVYFVVLMFAMRHQLALDRYVLPSIALLSVAVGRLAQAIEDLDNVFSAVFPLALLGAAGFVMYVNERDIYLYRRGLLPESNGVGGSEAARYDPELRPALEFLESRPPLRIGLLTSQSAPVRLFFGRRFEHVPVPLSFSLPADQKSFDALALDAIWFWGSGRCEVQIFKERFDGPRPHFRESYAVTSFRDLDADYVRAAEAVATYPDMCSTLGFLDQSWRVRLWFMEPRIEGRFLLVRGPRSNDGDGGSAPRLAMFLGGAARLNVRLPREGAGYVFGRLNPAGPERLEVTLRDETSEVAVTPTGWFCVPLTGVAAEEVQLVVRAEGKPGGAIEDVRLLALDMDQPR